MSGAEAVRKELDEGFNSGRRFTASLMAECTGVSHDLAARALDKMVREGALTTEDEHGYHWYCQAIARG
jgi:predicted secreted protein